MGFFDRLRTVSRVMRRGGKLEGSRLLRLRPGLMFGVSAYELGLLASNRVDVRLKTLAQIKVSALVGCPF